MYEVPLIRWDPHLFIANWLLQNGWLLNWNLTSLKGNTHLSYLYIYISRNQIRYYISFSFFYPRSVTSFLFSPRVADNQIRLLFAIELLETVHDVSTLCDILLWLLKHTILKHYGYLIISAIRKHEYAFVNQDLLLDLLQALYDEVIACLSIIHILPIYHSLLLTWFPSLFLFEYDDRSSCSLWNPNYVIYIVQNCEKSIKNFDQYNNGQRRTHQSP